MHGAPNECEQDIISHITSAQARSSEWRNVSIRLAYDMSNFMMSEKQHNLEAGKEAHRHGHRAGAAVSAISYRATSLNQCSLGVPVGLLGQNGAVYRGTLAGEFARDFCVRMQARVHHAPQK
eukprot:IDg16780t1